MDIVQLKYFVRIAESGSFTGAAESLGIKQPSLSHHVSKLEKELGTALFTRTGRGVELNSAGQTLYDHARAVLIAVDSAIVAVTGERAGDTAFTICAISSVIPWLVAPLVKPFRETFPDLQLCIVDCTPQKIASEVLSRPGCVGIATTQTEHSRLSSEPFMAEPLNMVLPAGHRLANCSVVSPDEVRDETVVFTQEIVSSVERIIGRPCPASDGRGDLSLPVNNVRSAISLIQHDFCAGIIPMKSLHDATQERLRIATLDSPFAERTLCMISRRETLTGDPANFLRGQFQAVSS